MKTVHQYLIDDYHGSAVMKNLLKLVQDKDYFIVTSNGDIAASFDALLKA